MYIEGRSIIIRTRLFSKALMTAAICSGRAYSEGAGA